MNCKRNYWAWLRHRTSTWYFSAETCVATSTGKATYSPASSTPPSSCSPPKSHSCTQEAIHETRGAYARNFSHYFAGPNGKFYYAFTYGPVRFIVLDCGEDKPDTDVEYSGLIDFDSYMLQQKDWLSREIDARVQERLPTVWLSHIFLSRKAVGTVGMAAETTYCPYWNKYK